MKLSLRLLGRPVVEIIVLRGAVAAVIGEAQIDAVDESGDEPVIGFV